MTVSNKHQRFASIAFDESKNSVMLSQHGCVIARGRQIVGKGINNYRTKSKDGFISDTSCSCHAEVDALRRVYQARIRKSGVRRTAKVA